MRSGISRRVRAGALLVALAPTQGCFVARSVPVSAIRPADRIRLEAPSGFVIRQTPTAGATRIAECSVVRISGDVARTSTDTVFLRRVVIDGPRTGGEMCRGDGVSYVVLSETPALQVQVKHFSYGRTVLVFVVIPGALLGGIWYIGMLTHPDA